MANRGTLLIAIAMLFGIYCFVLGESGIIERYRLSQERRKIETRILRLQEKNRQLAEIYERYRNGLYSPEDFLKAGFLGAGEKALYVKHTGAEVEKKEHSGHSAAEQEIDVELRYLRIFWIIISVVIVSIIILRKKPSGEE